MIRAACYITGGYSECGDMTAFISKMNPDLKLDQRCPIRPKYSKNRQKRTDSLREFQGMTGSNLISYVCKDIRDHFYNINANYNYDIIIIEDDLDFRFHEFSNEEIEKYYKQRQKDIENELSNLRVPASPQIYFLFASPELETWFLSDWDHSFKKYYSAKIKGELGAFFSNRLQSYLNNHVLGLFRDRPEEYFVFSGDYDQKGKAKSKKLSEEIQAAFDDVILSICNDSTVQDSFKSFFLECRTGRIHYSKKVHGAEMLSEIIPEIVASKCLRFFAPTYEKIRQLK